MPDDALRTAETGQLRQSVASGPLQNSQETSQARQEYGTVDWSVHMPFVNAHVQVPFALSNSAVSLHDEHLRGPAPLHVKHEASHAWHAQGCALSFLHSELEQTTSWHIPDDSLKIAEAGQLWQSSAPGPLQVKHVELQAAQTQGSALWFLH